jgi:type IV secretion system protein VirB1
MSMDPALVLALAAHCAPGVSAHTLLAVARAESALDPLAIGVNGGGPAPRRPATSNEAAALARTLIDQGKDLDLGLAQINVRNLAKLGLTPESVFDPCRNLAASARVLQDGYLRAAGRFGAGQTALRVALSYYNTGDPARGFRNGYVASVLAHARVREVPEPAALRSAPEQPAAVSAVRLRAASTFVLSPPGAAP